ncbi:ROK family transcriptional regulator [Actinomycetes bacterium KLBMP 9759]
MLASGAGDRARRERWRAAADVLAEVRREPGATRADIAKRLQLTSGSAAEIVGRLRSFELVGEVRAPASGRGRPTTVLTANPNGPLVVAAELRHEDWRCAVAGLDGALDVTAAGRHGDGADPERVLGAVRDAIRTARARHGDRVVAVSIAVAATVRDDGIAQAAGLGWGHVELTSLAGEPALPLLIGNDATLGGVAEARSGAAVGARTALHLLVEVGVGGVLVVDGRPLTGAGGAAGEYGHVPFGDRALRCPCGARGCWDMEVDGRALARHLGRPAPSDPRTFARDVLQRDDLAATTAIATVAGALASGIAGLVNAHDPDVVTLGGLAGPLRAAAPEEFAAALADGLMTFRQAAPPPVLDAVHGDDGALHGAAAVGLDAAVSASALADWADRKERHAG